MSHDFIQRSFFLYVINILPSLVPGSGDTSFLICHVISQIHVIINESCESAYFPLLVSFYIITKHQKIRDILIFAGGTKCVKSVRTRSFSDLYFPAFELNTERYPVSLRVLPECEKIRTRKTPNTDTFHAVTERDHWQEMLGTLPLTHLFPMHSFSTPWKHQKTLQFLMFSGGRERVHRERMD